MKRRAHVSTLTLGAVLALIAGSVGCGQGGEMKLENRLWINRLPSSPKANVAAMMILDDRVGHQFGSFYRGSLYRGNHDLFAWSRQGTSKGQIRQLQTGKKFKVSYESCRPDAGFDYCIILQGDPSKIRRYQSRKNWKLGKEKSRGSRSFYDALKGLDDAEISALLSFDEDRRGESS